VPDCCSARYPDSDYNCPLSWRTSIDNVEEKKNFITNIYKIKRVNMFLAQIKCEPVLCSPVDCNQPPANEGHEAMAAMSVSVALAAGAMVSLLAMGLMEGVGLILQYLPIFISGCILVVATVVIWYLQYLATILQRPAS
jgi:hypothetical protein